MLRVTPDHITARGRALQDHTEGGLIGLFRNFVIGFSLFALPIGHHQAKG